MKKRKTKKNPHKVLKGVLIGFLALFLGTGFGIGIFVFSKSYQTADVDTSKSANPVNDVPKIAKKVYDTCQTEESPQTCYERDIPKLMDSLSMEEAFQVVSYVQEYDRGYQYCHTLGHALSAREVQKDPSKWKEVLGKCPRGLCSNGCIHGGFQEKFRDLDILSNLTDEEQDLIIEELKTVCEARQGWKPTGMEQGSCYHALGHLLMYITFADTTEASDLCEVVAKKSDGRDFTSVCFDGVFMQIYQPLEDEDFALIKGKEVTRTTLLKLCNQYDGQKRGSCISEAWPLFFKELQDGPKGVETLCELEREGYKDRCYVGVTWVMTAQFRFDLEKMREYCAGYPKQRRGQCYADVVGRLIETDFRNVEVVPGFCSSIAVQEEKARCFDELVTFSRFNFPQGSPEARRMCELLEEPWKARCLSGL